MEDRWVTVRLKESDIVDIDSKRNELIESIGVSISRSAFLRGVIMKNLECGSCDQVAST